MCTECVEEARKLFPDANDAEIGAILDQYTMFPLAPVEVVKRQLQEHKETVTTGLSEAIATAVKASQNESRCPDGPTCETCNYDAELYITAAYPTLEKAIRAKVANEIKAFKNIKGPLADQNWQAGMTRAAQIAEGKGNERH